MSTAPVVSAARAFWCALRRLSGDDAYERYVGHHAQAHPGVPPLSRKAFYMSEQQRKWATINRCC